MSLFKPAGVLAVITLAISTVAAQDAAPGLRTFISDLTSPGIDNGLRDAGAPRPPRPYPTDMASREGLPYLRGSIVVKFRPGTAPAKRRPVSRATRGRARGAARSTSR